VFDQENIGSRWPLPVGKKNEAGKLEI